MPLRSDATAHRLTGSKGTLLVNDENAIRRPVITASPPGRVAMPTPDCIVEPVDEQRLSTRPGANW